MNWFDGLIIVLLAWFTFSAFQAGFIRETVTVVAAILGILLAGIFYKDLADDVLMFIDNETVALLVAFGILFGATALAGQMLALVLKPTVNLLQLGVFDQLIGAVFGFAKAMVFIQLFMVVFITYPKWGIDDTINNSVFGSLIVEKTSFVVNLMPSEFEVSVDSFNHQL